MSEERSGSGGSGRMLRIYVDADLAAGVAVELSSGQVNYLKNVMRLAAGDPAAVFNGRDGEWRAEVSQWRRKAGTLLCLERTRAQTPRLRLRYLFAPLKAARLDYMVQKATEMGAGSLEPVLTRHTMVSRVNTQRMKANAVEAAEQCALLTVPGVKEPVSLEAALRGWPPDVPLVYCDEAADAGSPLDALRRIGPGAPGVLIGPEGGFSGVERRMLAGLDFVVPVSLGPRVMRADTAAVAALAVIQASIGDW